MSSDMLAFIWQTVLQVTAFVLVAIVVLLLYKQLVLRLLTRPMPSNARAKSN